MAKRTNAVSVPQDWQAESDMRTLVEAQAIRGDKKRFAAATRMAKKKSEEMEKAFNTEPKED
jgi:hypothetical protein